MVVYYLYTVYNVYFCYIKSPLDEIIYNQLKFI